MAGKILAVWLASWALTLFPPCCEVIADVLPHDHHGQQQDLHVHHHNDDADSLPNHQHCNPDFGDVSDLSVPLSEKFQLNPPQTRLDIVTDWQAAQNTHTIAFARELFISYHPPPNSPGRLYLQTQRLRI